jgi:hypothetical protein
MQKVQTDMAAIGSRDQTREDSANRILLTLELANLKRAVERGGPYAKELADVKRLAPKTLDLSAIGPAAETGLPTLTALQNEFHSLTQTILDADQAPPTDDSLLDQLWTGAKSVVHVRRTGDVPGDSTEAILARTEARLNDGDLGSALREASALKGGARTAAQPWMTKVATRLAVDQDIADIETGLKKVMAPQATN